jgi:4,5-DOPA dioxygenase extradiol
MTHCFTVFRRPELAGHNAAFDQWATDAVTRGDVDALIDYRRKGPGADVAHKTPDHFVPLLLTMGASTTTGQTTTSGVDGMWFGNSIRSLQMV